LDNKSSRNVGEPAKYDLHRHLGGSILPETVWQIMQGQSGIVNLVSSVEDLTDIMTFKNDKKYGFHRFLQKFSILNNIKWTEKDIDLVIKQVIGDIAREGIDYCELRFSVDKYLNYMSWDEQEVCLFILNCIESWANIYNVEIGPVLSIKYESPKIGIKRISKLINHWRLAEKIVAIDIVGNELFFDPEYLRGIFRYWRSCGKGLLIHAGETQSENNVKIAIEEFGVDRVGHGIQIVNSPDILKFAVDEGAVFDIAISSNIMTGLVEDICEHPVKKMVEAGCNVVLSTDDPVVFDTNLDKEYEYLSEIIKSEDTVNTIRNNSILYRVKPN